MLWFIQWVIYSANTISAFWPKPGNKNKRLSKSRSLTFSVDQIFTPAIISLSNKRMHLIIGYSVITKTSKGRKTCCVGSMLWAVLSTDLAPPWGTSLLSALPGTSWILLFLAVCFVLVTLFWWSWVYSPLFKARVSAHFMHWGICPMPSHSSPSPLWHSVIFLLFCPPWVLISFRCIFCINSLFLLGSWLPSWCHLCGSLDGASQFAGVTA